MSEFTDKIKQFIYGSRRNAWLNYLALDVYMRKAKRSVEGIMVDCLDVATVTVTLPGQGDFTRFIGELEEIGYPIFVENVQTERFANFFKGRGYLVKPDESGLMWNAFKFGKQVKWKW